MWVFRGERLIWRRHGCHQHGGPPAGPPTDTPGLVPLPLSFCSLHRGRATLATKGLISGKAEVHGPQSHQGLRYRGLETSDSTAWPVERMSRQAMAQGGGWVTGPEAQCSSPCEVRGACSRPGLCQPSPVPGRGSHCSRGACPTAKRTLPWPEGPFH